MEALPFYGIQVGFSSRGNLPMVGDVIERPSVEHLARHDPFDGGVDLLNAQRRRIRVAGEGEAKEKIVAATASEERGVAGVPGDLIIGHERAAGAVGRDEAVIAHLVGEREHVRNGRIKCHRAVMAANAGAFMGRSEIAVRRQLGEFGEGHG